MSKTAHHMRRDTHERPSMIQSSNYSNYHVHSLCSVWQLLAFRQARKTSVVSTGSTHMNTIEYKRICNGAKVF